MVKQCSHNATARKNRNICLLRFIAVASGGFKTEFNLNSNSVSSISSLKTLPPNVIKVSAAILYLIHKWVKHKVKFLLVCYIYIGFYLGCLNCNVFSQL